MTCRRKTKTERELAADIRKTFEKFCDKNECMSCIYMLSYDCIIDYLVDLLDKYKEGEA